jgi:diguanylate cyclase (GGDEF)-like protein
MALGSREVGSRGAASMIFGQLSTSARWYIFGVCAVAFPLVVIAWLQSIGTPVTLAFVLLTLAATLAQCFPVTRSGTQPHDLSAPFFVAAALLLPPLQIMALLAAVHAVEGISRRRWWFAQTFTFAANVIAATTAHIAYSALWRDQRIPVDLGRAGSLIGGLLVVAAFLLVSRGLISVAIWFSTDIPPFQQHTFARESLLVDSILLLMGLSVSYLWVSAPAAVALVVAPLFLIHRALDLPNLRAQIGKDALSQLFTVEYLTEICRRELARCQRFGRRLAMIMLDVDRLGEINADYGYQTGDVIIQETANTVARIVGPYDVAARVLGGKFAILLPESDSDEASALAKRIQDAIAARRFDVPTSVEAISASVSIGVVVANGHSTSPDRLFSAAEVALANARRASDRRLYVYSMSPQSGIETPVTANSPVSGSLAFGGREIPESAMPTEDRLRPASVASTGAPWVSRLDHWFATHPTRSNAAMTAAVTLVALATVLASAPSFSHLELLTLLWLMILVALAETRDFQFSESTSYSISVVPIIAAGMLMGIPGAVSVAPVAALVRGIRRHTRWYQVVFHAIVYVIAAATATAAFELFSFGQHLSGNHVITLLLAAGMAGIGFYLHTFIVAASSAGELQTSLSRLWVERYRWLWPHYVVLSVMGLLLVLAYREFGIAGAAAFVVPPLMMRFVAKQYLDHTVENVRRLRTLNEELAAEIAHRTAVEEENTRLAQQVARMKALEELSRLKSEFISIASHELRTPMTSILGFSELLLARSSPNVPNRFMMSVIHDEAIRLSGLVDNLLDSSRIETGRLTVQLEPTDLGVLLPPLLKTLGGTTPKHTRLVELDPDARWVMADPARLQQILTNVIGNAIKYSPDGGRVVVAARSNLVAKSQENQVIVSVSDEGIGIPPEYLDRIFDQFQRVDSSETRTIRGTGLGLYVARHLVELHGGVMYVESEVGRGSTFSFTLKSAVPVKADETPDEPLAISHR